MADDGMVLNFSLSDIPAPPAKQQKFKGGSWKERWSARNEARGRPAGTSRANRKSSWRTSDSVNNTPIPDKTAEDLADSRPAKRRKENNETTTGAHDGRHPARRPQANEKRHRDSGVISSLFRTNPQPTAPQAPSVEVADEAPPIQPSNAPLPDGIETFTDLGLSVPISAHLLSKMELKNPTAIQKAALSQLLKEEGDAFIQSETGSGKTLAYLLPLVQKIMHIAEVGGVDNQDKIEKLHRDSGLFAIVLAPTRELCKQISVVLDRLLGCARHIVAGTVIGGEKKKSEKARLRKGINILVATPGRLVDHLDNTEVLDVSKVRWLVLDEGDRLMDMGFEEDIGKIVKTLDQKKRKSTVPGLPESRTTILCSATIKMSVQKLGDISLKNATRIQGDQNNSDETPHGETSSAFLAPAQLRQSYMIVPPKQRLVTLNALLKHTFARKGSVMKAIVFFSCADSVDFHFKALTRTVNPDNHDEPSSSNNSPYPSPDLVSTSTSSAPQLAETLTLHRLHGSLPQATRTSIVKTFSTSTTPSLLLATDVASRGLDLPNLDLVIEYDPAFSSDDHLHRIGRTARLGRDGRAIIFLTPGKEEGYVEVLRSSFRSTEAGSSSITHTSADDILRKGFTPTTGVVGRSNARKEWEAKATEWQLDIEQWILADKENHEMAKRAFQSHVRAYATHISSERKFFDIKELHLGHLAKAFGLRDAPGGLNMKGMRGKNDGGGKRKRIVGGSGDARRSEGDQEVVDGKKADYESQEAARKMREVVRNWKMMMGGGADEFNLA